LTTTAKDPNFWSVRVTKDIRLIVHKTEESLLLCYVDHHDGAYKWAERRKLETHPKTGAAQLVEIRETVKELVVPVYVEKAPPAPTKPILFKGVDDDVLLGYGVPAEWLDDVKTANEDSILELAEHLPSEAAEALLDLAVGAAPPAPATVAPNIDPFEHPDAQRRFRVMKDVEELTRALEYPWEKWTIFLHPAQRQIVELNYNGPARVSGSAGTGKTIVALHRAVHLARNNPDARVLLTTFSDNLANALRAKLRRLISNEPRLSERLEVHSMDSIGRRLYELQFSRPKMATKEAIVPFLKQAANETEHQKFSLHFLWTEWDQVVDAWQLDTWEAYRDVIRLGRKIRLPEKQRQVLWSIFEKARTSLKKKGLVTYSGLFSTLANKLRQDAQPPFNFAVVDEAQDITIPQLRFLAAMGGDRSNALFFAGDLGQRIFQQPFSWKSSGVDIRGRSKTLKINYRTSHQIRMQADRLLAPEVSDVDGNIENRSGTISVFNGPRPTIEVTDSIEDEIKLVAAWIGERLMGGVKPHEIGVFVRSPAEIGRATSAVEAAGQSAEVLDHCDDGSTDHVFVGTMHLAKGLEFRAVAVMACDDEIIPLQERIEGVTDEADLEEVYNTERQLLYVACTRARDHLIVTAVEPASEFIDDMLL
jgi:superfamily I DNA/RNA helicase